MICKYTIVNANTNPTQYSGDAYIFCSVSSICLFNINPNNSLADLPAIYIGFPFSIALQIMQLIHIKVHALLLRQRVKLSGQGSYLHGRFKLMKK